MPELATTEVQMFKAGPNDEFVGAVTTKGGDLVPWPWAVKKLLELLQVDQTKPASDMKLLEIVGMTVRFIKLGDLFTQEYNEHRINIEFHPDDHTITRVWKG